MEKPMTSREIRKRFLDFFEKRGHSIVPSASLIPENDPSVLFTTAGMQPLVPYLLGESHPSGKRIANIQKCLRTGDIEEVGDQTHLTFFEMMGNWSLGDYFKKDAISWSFELLTSKHEGFGLDPNRLYITVFAGDKNAPRDNEAKDIWLSLGVSENRIYFKTEANWWSPGDNGPCGPDTEIMYDITENGLGDLSEKEFEKAEKEQKIVEIWNNVFMAYEKKDGNVVGELKNKNVDTGAGFERLVSIINKKDIFDTDLFEPILKSIKENYSIDGKLDLSSEKNIRVIADHMRASVFLVADGAIPSNNDAGYVLRRLIRRSIFRLYDLNPNFSGLDSIINSVIENYSYQYKKLKDESSKIHEIIKTEELKFMETLKKGRNEFEKISNKKNMTGKDAFILFSTYGFPIELTEELAKEKGIEIDHNEYQEELKKHQELSRTANIGKFKGGLAGDSEVEKKYHTATHLLNAALRRVLGNHIYQKGSNINTERMRFDFSHSEKMTDQEKDEVEKKVNEWISGGLDVVREEMSYDEAKSIGAIGVFEDKYGDTVSVYSIKNGDEIISMELCGGPHVKNTSEIGEFKIKKEEASSAGVRRIKAIIKNGKIK